MKYAVCTSFSPKGYELYGKRFVESYMSFKNPPLFVYAEAPPPPFSSSPSIRDLSADPDLASFLSRWDGDWRVQGVRMVRNGKKFADYRWQADKFCRKVFAVTDPGRQKSDWWIWIDADVIVKKPIVPLLDRICQKDALLAYVGRRDWHHSECGFVAYNQKHPRCAGFLADFRASYSTDSFLKEQEWHDSWIFDSIRERYENCKQVNIAEGIAGTHPWEQSILQEYMEHNKGPELKQKAYGASV